MEKTFQHTTQTLWTILAAITKPLHFASRNNCANLSAVKGLDTLIPRLAQSAIRSGVSADIEHKLNDIILLFSGFSGLDTQQRKQVIRKAVSIIDSIRQAPSVDAVADELPDAENRLLTTLDMPVEHIKGIGPKLSEALSRLGAQTIEDLLYTLPRTYIDRRTISSVSCLRSGQSATVAGVIENTGQRTFGGRKKMHEIRVSDKTGELSAKWFNIPASYVRTLKAKFKPGDEVIVSGTVSQFRFMLEMHHPEIEITSSEEDISSRLSITPVYPLTEGLHQKTIQRIMKQVVQNYAADLPDYLPAQLREKYSLAPLSRSLCRVHVPGNDDDIKQLNSFSSPWHRRIVFDEFFRLQAALALKKKHTSRTQGIAHMIDRKRLDTFLSTLPFRLTTAQNSVLESIVEDMEKPLPMNRLIQGDVGSGKTVVCLLACLCCIWNGYQAAIMAPTEILAEQHYRTITDLTASLGLPTVLLTGSCTKAQRRQGCEAIRQGDATLAIGTHALIQEGVSFCRLGLVVVDEQHKFGVMQRAQFKLKADRAPDTLVMTATPIPRTLGLTVYGDLDVSVINELPPGRKPVATTVMSESSRSRAYEIVRHALALQRQAFIIYPLVEESEKMDLKDATRMAAHLQHDVFTEHRVGLIHGKMDRAQKADVMKDFQAGQIHILVATTVVEVGIDVPNASIMIIEHAERFGLSQLHQLRGRIGRGAHEAACILLAQHTSAHDALRRLKVMEKTNDGFKIAEEDFNIRGPGEFLGTRQSGLPDFRVAHIGRDIQALVQARTAAFELIDRDPLLEHPGHALLKSIIFRHWSSRFNLAEIG